MPKKPQVNRPFRPIDQSRSVRYADLTPNHRTAPAMRTSRTGAPSRAGHAKVDAARVRQRRKIGLAKGAAEATAVGASS
jgi:hypothetical protein